ncbi:MAG: hypothetical protein RPS47_04485 [Colwellia sp.]|jgi:hypothetical protein
MTTQPRTNNADLDMARSHQSLEDKVKEAVKGFSNTDTPVLERLYDFLQTFVLRYGHPGSSAVLRHPELGVMYNELQHAFKERHGLAHALEWDGDEVWLAVDSVADAERLKPKLTEMGFSRHRTFTGSIHGNARQLILKSGTSKKFWGYDGGPSEEYLNILTSVGLNPDFVMVTSGPSRSIMAEFALTLENVAAVTVHLEILAKSMSSADQSGSHELQSVLTKDAYQSLDAFTMHLPQYGQNLNEISIEGLRVMAVDYAMQAQSCNHFNE